ncbi:MAG: secondary thiamine-phosphate synthase enzyme YjbQ [Planctomycetota bacterium]
MIHREEMTFRTRGETQVIDVTESVRAVVKKSGVREGTVHLFVPGSTAGLTTIEHEPGCVKDLEAAFERMAPRHGPYEHNARWGDGNGFSHVRAALLGPSLAVPVGDAAPLLGTWQQVVLVDFDNRPRERKVLVTVTGE